MRALVGLLESIAETFYEHIETEIPQRRLELQWIDKAWRYRFVPYSGEWAHIDSPVNIPGIDFNDLEYFVNHWLLTHYAYNVIFVELTFDARRIEKFFGSEVCSSAVSEMNAFGEALGKAIGALLVKTPQLTIARDD